MRLEITSYTVRELFGFKMKNLVLRPVGGGNPKYTCRDWKDFLDKCANTDDALKLAVMDGHFPVWLEGECPIGYQLLDGAVGRDWTKWRGHEFLVGVILMSLQDQDKLPESLRGKLPDDLVKLVSKAFAPNGGNVAKAEVEKFLEGHKEDLLRVYDDETGFEVELNFRKKMRWTEIGVLNVLLEGRKCDIGTVRELGDRWVVDLNANCACDPCSSRWVMNGVDILDMNDMHPNVELSNGERVFVRVRCDVFGAVIGKFDLDKSFRCG